ncbi:mannosyltransferase family protein [Paenibacillus sp. SI8]|uniref:mannosyltransferase family protein n=1 Tax=unclassified Paenibacillus TaxID=185978 RepID=UPI00346626DD
MDRSKKRIPVRIILSIVLLVLVSRALMLFTGYVGMNLFSQYSSAPVYQQNAPGSMSEWTMKLPQEMESTRKLQLEDFIKFDTYSYLKIATEGYDRYRMNESHTAANWVFFPLYPLLIYLIRLIIRVEPAVVGIVISNLCLIAALVYMYFIALQRGLTERQARTVLLLVIFYPASLYYSVPYTESLFLLLSAASIYYAGNRQYALAFLAASLSTVTRVPGFVNLAFVIGTVGLNEGQKWTWRYAKWALYSLLSLIPMGIYLLHMKAVTGDLLAPFHEQSLHWFRYTTQPFKNYVGFLKKPYFATLDGWDNGLIAFTISTAVFLLFIVYFLVHVKHIFRNGHELLFFGYGVLLIVIPFSSQPLFLVSVVRYMMVSIPLYYYAVTLTSKWESSRLFYFMLFMILQVVMTIGYFNGYYFVI